MALLRWLTSPLGSLTVTLINMLFWTYLIGEKIVGEKWLNFWKWLNFFPKKFSPNFFLPISIFPRFFFPDKEFQFFFFFFLELLFLSIYLQNLLLPCVFLCTLFIMVEQSSFNKTFKMWVKARKLKKVTKQWYKHSKKLCICKL